MEQKKIISMAMLILMGIILLYTLSPFINSFFGAIIFFVLLKPIYAFFVKKGINKSLSAILVIIFSLLIIIVPLFFVVVLIISKVNNLINNGIFLQIFEIHKIIPNKLLQDLVSEVTPDLLEIPKTMVLKFSVGIIPFIIVTFIMYCILYYLLIKEEKLKFILFKYSPFFEKNTRLLIKEFKTITKSTILANGIVAIIQGSLLAFFLLILGFKDFFLIFFIGTVIAFIPLFGTAILWIPLSLIQFAQGNSFIGLMILISGSFVGTIDNFIRPYLQKKYGSVHPLTSIIGIFMGIAFFGVFGIVIGPLLLSIFLLLFKIVKEEFNESKTIFKPAIERSTWT